VTFEGNFRTRQTFCLFRLAERLLLHLELASVCTKSTW